MWEQPAPAVSRLLRLKFSDQGFIFRQGHTFLINRLIAGAILFLESQIGFPGSPDIKRQIAARVFIVADKLRANVAFAVPKEAHPVALWAIDRFEIRRLAG